jgi:hypothetical protein
VCRETLKTDYVEENGDSASLADSKARFETAEKEQDAISLKYKAKLLSITRDGLGVTIDVIRSKLSYIKQDMNNSGV